MIQLKKPLAFFDLETTGLDVTNDRIIEIGILKMNPDGSQESYSKRVNPEMPISKESAEITGISDDDVKNYPAFRELAEEIAAFIGDADLAGYNSNKFDIPVLAEEFLRAESDFDMSARRAVDVQNIFHKMEQRTLAAAYQFYCSQELKNAHSAMADIEATKDVFIAQLEKYDTLEKDVDFLADFTRVGSHELLDFAGRIARNEHGEVVYNFGKHKGKSLEQVDKEEQGYYGWLIHANFPLYTKKVLKDEMEKIKAKRQAGKQSVDDKMNALKSKFMG
jgi:DNA polymerase-3 subunit epsilon